MFRGSLHYPKLRKVLRHKNDFEIITRNQSTQSNKSKSYLALGLLGATTVGIGGSLIYAKFDDNFRNSLETSLPFTKNILKEILGNTQNELSKDLSSSKSKVEDSLLKKKLQSDTKTDHYNLISQHTTEVKSNINVDKTHLGEKISKENAPIFQGPVQPKFGAETKVIDNLENPLGIITPTPLLINFDSTNEKPFEETSSSSSETGDQIMLERALAKQRFDLEVEYQKKLDVMKEEYENELKQQVKRLMAAHFYHLADELDIQRKDLERELNLAQEDKIIAIKREYQSQLGNSLYHLDKIENTLKTRERLDEDELKARHLWLLCQSLRDALKCSGVKEPFSLKEKIDSVVETVNSMEGKNSLTLSVLKTIPQSALEEGVYNEDSLLERFKKVDNICKRVALVGDGGGNLFNYLCSYLQSILLIGTVNIPDFELDENKKVDPSKWDTFDILARVRMALDKRDLELSLRYANQLRGEARKVAKDWIKDTRIHLEVKQATVLIQAQAASITLQSVK